MSSEQECAQEGRTRFEWSRLLDLYAGLLPEKQREFLELHYHEDLSLSEIAETHQVSRQAAHDAVSKGKQALLFYEEQLNLLARENENRGTPDKVEILAKAKDLIERIRFDLRETPIYETSKVLARLRELEKVLVDEAS